MRLPILFLAAAVLGAQAPPALPPSDPASMTVDQVLAKCFEAQGGLAKLRAVQSRHITGHIEGLPDPISFDQLNARPDRIRLETRTESKDSPATDQIKTCDGKTGWAWSNTEAARVMEPEEVKVLDADFDGPLVDAAAKGHKVEFKGLQEFQNQKALVLKVTLKDKRVQMMYLDPKTFLKFAQVNGEGKAGVELDFWDYQTVDGLPMAYTVIIGPVSVRVDKITLNVPVTDADFQPPRK
ncbi:MAG TPA: hypothetical protein VFF76_07545 [Holophagaceae bacterium]|jgi:hypothetical protein|nr:hypothetical protein [Holophagaceae bacterium]